MFTVFVFRTKVMIILLKTNAETGYAVGVGAQ